MGEAAGGGSFLAFIQPTMPEAPKRSYGGLTLEWASGCPYPGLT